MNNVIEGGGTVDGLSEAFTTIGTNLASIDFGEIWTSITSFGTIWIVLIGFTIGLMLLRRVLGGARKGKAKI